MSERPNVPALPQPERRLLLEEFLAVIDADPALAPLRQIFASRPDRQLALVAALERAILLGSPASARPSPDDEADQLLCDILDALDRDPDLKNRGAYYGSYQRLANLQALGLWHRDSPITRPTAHELFAAHFSALTSDDVSTSPVSAPNYSPPPQDSSPNGELITVSTTTQSSPTVEQSSPQPLDSLLLVSITADHTGAMVSSSTPGIIRHDTNTHGENLLVSPSPCLPVPSTPSLPHRPLRRGRPTKLDDFAKGRILGLMSYGLSFRQAAAQLGVHHQTVLNALKRDEQFAQQVSEARLDAISQPLLTVVHASRTNWRAAAWLAKYLDDHRRSSLEPTPGDTNQVA